MHSNYKQNEHGWLEPFYVNRAKIVQNVSKILLNL